MKFFLTILFFIFVFPTVLRWVLRLFIANQVNKAQRDFFQQQDQPQSRGNGRAKGDKINIDHIPNKNDSKGYKGGDYIDYEEVK